MRLHLLAVLAFAGCVDAAEPDDPAVIDADGKEDGALATNINVALGAPRDGFAKDDLLIVRSQYVNSYNPFRNGPNWVAWHLTATDIGTTPRASGFHADTSLPAGVYRVYGNDYSNQGYDRGHMCDSEDRSATSVDNHATFAMTNMLPQHHELNAGPWQGFELYCRSLVESGSDLFVIAGGTFGPECDTRTGSPSSACPTIGARSGRIAVPDTTWKVVVVVPRGGGATSVTTSSRVIAVEMPNGTGDSSQNWTPYVTTAATIEQHTGYKLFTALPVAVARALRAHQDSP